MNIKLEPLHATDAELLLAFERENRSYFEKMVPGRGEDYYKPETFRKRHSELLEEQENGFSRFYLIMDPSGAIVGRINLVDIDPADGKAEVGYRIGEEHTGKGIANKALKQLLSAAVKENVKKIHAKTTNNNIASQKVLEKNGFRYDSVDENEFLLHGQPVKIVHYIWP